MPTKTSNKKIDPKEFLNNLGYKIYADDEVVKTLPYAEGECVFFKLDKYISDDDLEKEYASRNLVAASPYAMLATPTEKLDEMKYVGTHWKDKDDKWCFSTFDRWNDVERSVYVSRRGSDWDDFWWFAGLRKSALSTQDPKTSSVPLDLELRVQKLEEKLQAIADILK